MNKARLTGLCILLLLIIIAVLGSIFFNDIASQNLANKFASPSLAEPLGTDHFGRSNAARLSNALLLSLVFGLICTISATLLGGTLGVLAGYFGGKFTKIVDFIADTIVAIPALVIILLISAIVPGSFINIYVAISIVMWVEFYRTTKNSLSVLKNSAMVEASLLYGFSNLYIFKRIILPNIVPKLVFIGSFSVAKSILIMASLGFVYAGLKPPSAELGLMIVELFPYYSMASFALLQPITALFLITISLNLLAQGSKNAKS